MVFEEEENNAILLAGLPGKLVVWLLMRNSLSWKDELQGHIYGNNFSRLLFLPFLALRLTWLPVKIQTTCDSQRTRRKKRFSSRKIGSKRSQNFSVHWTVKNQSWNWISKPIVSSLTFDWIWNDNKRLDTELWKIYETKIGIPFLA